MDDLITNISLFPTEKEAVEYYFRFYRKNGFPDYDISDYNYQVELSNLIKFDESSILLNNKELKQTMHNLGFLWSIFPHWIETSTEVSDSIQTLWKDDSKLYELIKKTVQYAIKHNNSIWTENRIRQNAKVYLSKQSVSNFRPTVAKYIYNTYGNNGKVFDPCAGWGGRFLGYLASDCIEYVCCDPSINTYKGLLKLQELYEYTDKKSIINNVCAEDYYYKDDYFDLVFTSPPYFNTEHYSNEDSQSYVRYATYDVWRDNFLKPLIVNSYKMLKLKGYFIINIADVKTALTLEKDTVEFALGCGFTLEDTLKLVLSSISGKGKKYEPVFIFKK